MMSSSPRCDKKGISKPGIRRWKSTYISYPLKSTKGTDFLSITIRIEHALPNWPPVEEEGRVEDPEILVKRWNIRLSLFFTFFAENFQQESLAWSVFKESRNNNDCTDQPDTQPEDSRDEKRENDQNAPQDGTNHRLLLPHVFCSDHRVHLFSLMEKMPSFSIPALF